VIDVVESQVLVKECKGRNGTFINRRQKAVEYFQQRRLNRVVGTVSRLVRYAKSQTYWDEKKLLYRCLLNNIREKREVVHSFRNHRHIGLASSAKEYKSQLHQIREILSERDNIGLNHPYHSRRLEKNRKMVEQVYLPFELDLLSS